MRARPGAFAVLTARVPVPSGFLVWLVVAIFALPSAEAQVAARPSKGPEIQAELVGGKVAIDGAGSATLRIRVRIPARHHGYLGRGDEGFLIPFTFTFPALEERGVKVSLLSGPRGTRDNKVRATVLREGGEFVFRLDGAGGRLPAGKVVAAFLEYQICDDATQVCYPPRRIQVPLPLGGPAAR